MAGAEKLIEKILADAKADAENSGREADEKKRAIREAVERDIEKQKALIEKDAASSKEENKRRMAAVFDLEYRKELLAAKQEMMGKARDLAMEKLIALPDDKYLTLMKAKLISCAINGTGAILVSKKEKRISDAFLADVNKELKSSAGKGEVKLLPDKKDIAGGFIFTEGGMEVNMSLEALLTQAWQESETDVAAILFE